MGFTINSGPTTIRLVGGGGPWEGRVDVMHNGKWGSVCDTNFGNEEATVVCRMLGFKDRTTESYARNASFFGSSSNPILLDQISCTGSELDINACRTKKWGFHTCDNDHEAGVLCRASNLRLSGGSHTMEGRVEVLFNGKWSTICDEEWDDNEATTICRMLTSYPLNKIVAGKAFRNSYFGGGSYTAALSNLKCNGSEVDLLHCSMNKGGRPHCDHSRDAGVSCSLNAASYLNGQNQMKGTFQTQISNYSGSICDRDVNESVGTVLCKALGYWSNTAVVYRNSWFGQGQGTSFDLKPKCTGKESNILFCNLGNTFGRQTCTHSQDIGVQCTATPLGLFKIRLALGNSKGDGRLEIKYNDKWGTVCSTDWTPQNSEVVCRMLGFRHPIIQTKAVPRNDTHVLLGSLSCIGPEHDIGFCKGTVDKSNCTNEVINIDCTGGMEIKLSGGSSPADGRIDVKQNGQWGSLCDSSYTLSDLQVLCNMLGYRDTLPYQYHLPSVEIHKAPFGIDTLSCSGYEDHIMQCLFSKTASCHHRYAHLKCFDCVYEHTTTTGTIVSDHYPGRYIPDTDCLYIIKPPHGLYKVVVDVLQMADTGDFIQIKDSPLGKELGYYSVSSYIPAAVSNEFWIRFKTNGQKSARGFKLHWSPFEVKDLLSLNCEIDRWGAAINITLLRMTSMYVNYSDIYLTNPDCFGQVIGDKLMFDQLYGECGSTKNDSGLFITYQNNLTLIADNVTYEIPLECKIFKDDRVFHFHPGFDYMELDKPADEDKKIEIFFIMYLRKPVHRKRSSDSLYEINLFFDSELTLQDVTDFNGKFVYIINRHDSNMQLSLNACNFTMHRKDTDDFFSIVENSKPVLETVRVKNVHPGSIQLEIQISENVPSVLECDFVSK
ncbi:unnamed protein product [Mytilus coruscus]|uniref:DMBT1 n=1 Tax=Mytilus coruscus TaxID=42192 RepID=A0A6J8ANT1_MYTCO|nr:unnamed protein product [Mytilus coruscus]